MESAGVRIEIFDPVKEEATEIVVPDVSRAGPELLRWLGGPPAPPPHDLYLRALDLLARQLITEHAKLDPPPAEAFHVYADLLEQLPLLAPKLIAIAALLAPGATAEHAVLVRALLDRELATDPSGAIARLRAQNG